MLVKGERQATVQLNEPRASGCVSPYTAPEQLQGTGDERSDIFAFGAVLYEMATGCTPFDTGAFIRRPVRDHRSAVHSSGKAAMSSCHIE